MIVVVTMSAVFRARTEFPLYPGESRNGIVVVSDVVSIILNCLNVRFDLPQI